MASSTTVLQVKIYLESNGSTKGFRFPGDQAVADILKEIREKTNEGGKDYGLFLPPNPLLKTPGQWLERNRALRFYNIKNDSRLEYKKKHRPLPIRTVDDAEKKILIDDSLRVRAICDIIAEKLMLGKHGDQFCLAIPGNGMKNPKWLREDKTLHEQFVEPGITLEFLKRYSVLDKEVAVNDAHVLHILYVTTLKQIVEDVYPITRNDARDFASLQLQVIYGDHTPEKHKPGFADLSTMLPKKFMEMKDKEEQKRLFQEIYLGHKKLKGTKDSVAKNRYIQLARALKTYGYTFFDCLLETEEVVQKKKKNFSGKTTSSFVSTKKTEKAYFGVSAEFFCLFDLENNTFKQKFEFRHMREWNATQQHCRISFLVPEGEVIYNLIYPDAVIIAFTINGYMHLLLKVKKDKERVISDSSGEIGEIDDQAVEEWGQSGAQYCSAYRNPALNGGGQGTWGGFGGGAQPFSSEDGGDRSIANVNNLPSAMRASKLLASDLVSGKGNWGKKGALTEEGWKKQFDHHKTLLTGDMNEFMSLLSGDDGKLNRKNLDLKGTSLHMNLTSLATAARNLSALNGEETSPLLDGAKALCDSLADLMGLVMDSDVKEAGDGPTMKDIMVATHKQFTAAMLLLNNASLAAYVDKGTQVLLLECIGDVDTRLQHLVGTVRAQNLTPEHRAILELECKKAEAIKGVALATMANLCPHLGDNQVLMHIHYAKTTIQDLIGGLEMKWKMNVKDLSPLGTPLVQTAVDDVQLALKNLFEASKSKEVKGVQGDIDIITPSIMCLNSLAGVRAAIRTADVYQLTNAAAFVEPYSGALVSVIKTLAPQIPVMTAALETLSETLTGDSKIVVENATLLQANPESIPERTTIFATMGVMESAIQNLISDVGQTTAINNLRFHSKKVAADIVRLTTAITSAKLKCPEGEQPKIGVAAKEMTEALGTLLNLLQIASSSPDNILAQQALLEGVQKQLPKLYEFIQIGASMVPLLQPFPNVQQSLEDTVKMTHVALFELEKSCHRIDDMHGNILVAEALSSLELIKADLETAGCFAEQGTLIAAHNVALPTAIDKLTQAAARLKTDLDQVTSVAKEGQRPLWADHVLAAARSLDKVAEVSIMTARAIPDRLAQQRIVGGTIDSLNDIRDLVAASRVLAHDPSNAYASKIVDRTLAQAATHLEAVLASAQGFNPVDIEQAIKLLNAHKAGLSSPPALQGDLHTLHQAAAARLTKASKAIALPINSFLITAKTVPNQLGYSAKLVAAAVGQILDLSAVLAYTNEDGKEATLTAAKKLADQMAELLSCSHQVATQVSGSLERAQKISADLLATVGELRATVKAAPSALSDLAIRDILASLAKEDQFGLKSVGLTRPELLQHLEQGSSQLASLIKQLEQTTPGSLDQNDFASKTAVLLDHLIVAAHSCELSNGSVPVVSLSAARILQGCDLILSNIDNSPLVSNILDIALVDLAPLILEELKQRIRTETDPLERSDLVMYGQDFQKAIAKCIAAKRSNASPEALKVDVLALRDVLLDLEASVNDLQKFPLLAFSPVAGKQLVAGAKSLAIPTTTFLRTTALLNSDPESSLDYKSSLNDVKEALQSFVSLCSSFERSQEETQKAIQTLQKASADLDTANLFAKIGALEVTGAEKTKIQASQLEAKAICQELVQCIRSLVGAAKSSSKAELQESAVGFQGIIPNYVEAMILVGASMDDSVLAQRLLLQGKQFPDSLKDLLEATKSLDKLNPATMAAFAMYTGKSTQDLSQCLSLLNSGVTVQSKLDETVIATRKGLEGLKDPQKNGDYDSCIEKVTHQARLVGTDIAALLNSETEAQVLSAASKLSASCPGLLEASRAAIAVTSEVATKEQLIINSNQIGKSVITAVEKVKGILVGSGEKPQLLSAFNATNLAIAGLLSSAKAGEAQVVMLDSAADSILSSLASLAVLKVSIESGSPAEFVDFHVLQDSLKKLGNPLAKLDSVSSALLKRDVALESKNLSNVLNELLTQCGLALPGIETKLRAQMLNDCAEIALDSSRLVLLGKQSLKDSSLKSELEKIQKNMAKTVRSFQEKLEACSKDSQMTPAQLTANLAKLEAVLKATPVAQKGATPNDLKRVAKLVTIAAAELMTAQSDERAIEVSGSIPGLLTDLFSISLGVPDACDFDPNDFLLAAKATADALANLMNLSINLPPRDQMSALRDANELIPSRNLVTKSISALVDCLKKLPVKQPEPSTVNPTEVKIDETDIEAFAENELLKCAQAIKDACLLLMQAAPVKKGASVGLDISDINEAILEAARAIALATGSLIECAAVSQAERKEEAKSGVGKYFADPSWANGLISAAQSVAGQVKALVESANDCCSGKAEQERLLACARQVAATTVHLVTASRTKSDPGAQSQRNLSNASSAVTVATQQLVIAANASSALHDNEEEEDFSRVNFAAASGIRAQMEQRSKIDKLEKELREKRQELLTLRRSRYNKNP